MNAFHLSVSVLNVLCGIAALAGFIAQAPSVLATGVFLGYWANLIAVAVALVLVAIVAIRARSGQSRKVIAASWLGLLNGAVVVLAWIVFFSLGKFHTIPA